MRSGDPGGGPAEGTKLQMACSTFEKRIAIHSSADAIYAELSDPGRRWGRNGEAV